MREAGQGRNPAALSDVGCVLFLLVNKKAYEINDVHGFSFVIYKIFIGLE